MRNLGFQEDDAPSQKQAQSNTAEAAGLGDKGKK
jgi:hypothetical protein